MSENKTPLFFEGSIKMLRETLCVAATEIQTWAPENFQSKLDDIQQLINEIDRHRPLGPDGKHGNRHTNYCGCEDKPGWDKDLGDLSRFYTKVVLGKGDGPSLVLNAEGQAMHRSLSRSLFAFQTKRNELLLAMDDNVPDRLEKLGRTEATVKHYEGLMTKLMNPLMGDLEMHFDPGPDEQTLKDVARLKLLRAAMYNVGHISPEAFALRKEINSWWRNIPVTQTLADQPRSPWFYELEALREKVGHLVTQVKPVGYNADDPSMHHPERRNPNA